MSNFLLKYWKNTELLRKLVESHGAWAPLWFIALQALQVILAPIPGEATGFLAGFLFGPWKGFIYAMMGLILGSSGAFFLARNFQHFFRHRFEKNPYYQRLSVFMTHKGILAAFACFLIPGFPKDYLCYFLGLFPIPWPVFLLIMSIGRIPGTLALTLQGAAVYQKDWKTFLLVAALSLLFFIIFFLLRDRIYSYLEERK